MPAQSILYFKSTDLSPSGILTFHHRRHARCLVCHNTLDDKDPEATSSCRPIEAINSVYYGQAVSNKFRRLGPVQTGNLSGVFVQVGSEQPSGQKSVVAVSEARAMVPDKFRRRRLKAGLER